MLNRTCKLTLRYVCKGKSTLCLNEGSHVKVNKIKVMKKERNVVKLFVILKLQKLSYCKDEKGGVPRRLYFPALQ